MMAVQKNMIFIDKGHANSAAKTAGRVATFSDIDREHRC